MIFLGDKKVAASLEMTLVSENEKHQYLLKLIDGDRDLLTKAPTVMPFRIEVNRKVVWQEEATFNKASYHPREPVPTRFGPVEMVGGGDVTVARKKPGPSMPYIGDRIVSEYSGVEYGFELGETPEGELMLKIDGKQVHP